MPLFPELARVDPSPSRNLESHYSFLNRVHTPFWNRVRGLLDSWYEAYPADSQRDLAGRLMADNPSHRAAWWELYLYSVLHADGFDVTPHPPVPGQTHRPDFVAARMEHTFYVEATTIGHKPGTVAEDNLLESVHHLLNRMEIANFFLDVDIESFGPQAPGIRPLRAQLEAWLDQLDPDDVVATYQAEGVLPDFGWQSGNGWTLRFKAIPKSSGRGQAGSPAVGIWAPRGASVVDHHGDLLAPLAEKGGRYGVLANPYVIAISDDRISPPSDQDIAAALYGRTAGFFNPATDTITPMPERQTDGFWHGPAGPRNGHVSAVVVAWSISPWEVTRRVPTVWINPWADHPLGVRLPWRTFEGSEAPSDPRLRHDGVDPAKLLSLPGDWPGPEEPFEFND